MFLLLASKSMFLCSLFRVYAYDSNLSQQLVLPNTTQKNHRECVFSTYWVVLSLARVPVLTCSQRQDGNRRLWAHQLVPDLLQRTKNPAHSAITSAHQHSERGDFGERMKPPFRNKAKGERSITMRNKKKQSLPTLFNVTHYWWILKKEWKSHSPVIFCSWRPIVSHLLPHQIGQIVHGFHLNIHNALHLCRGFEIFFT